MLSKCGLQAGELKMLSEKPRFTFFLSKPYSHAPQLNFPKTKNVIYNKQKTIKIKNKCNVSCCYCCGYYGGYFVVF
jgi:hypothetical protein